MPTRQELKEEAKRITGAKTVAEMFVPQLIYMVLLAVLSGLSVFAYVPMLLSPLVAFMYLKWLQNFIRQDQVTLDNYFNTLKDVNKDVEYTLTSIMRDFFVALWSILLIVPGLIYYYATAMVPYLLAEDENFKYLDCLKLSKDMMKGHKMELFMLDLSFLGWILLCLLTFGILFIWKGPYIATTKALYYEHLKKEYIASNPGVFKMVEEEEGEIIDAVNIEDIEDAFNEDEIFH